MKRTMHRSMPRPGRWLLSIAFAAACGIAPTQASNDAGDGEVPFRISQRVLAGGGVSHASSACFDLAATIAEPIVGRSSGGAFVLVAGFLGEAEARGSIFRSSFEDCQP